MIGRGSETEADLTPAHQDSPAEVAAEGSASPESDQTKWGAFPAAAALAAVAALLVFAEAPCC